MVIQSNDYDYDYDNDDDDDLDWTSPFTPCWPLCYIIIIMVIYCATNAMSSMEPSILLNPPVSTMGTLPFEHYVIIIMCSNGICHVSLWDNLNNILTGKPRRQQPPMLYEY